MKLNFVVLAAFLAISGNASAGLSDVVNLGKGRYMIGGTSATVFGNSSKMQAKAMEAAHQHCARMKTGSEAVVQDMRGEDGKAGGGGFFTSGNASGGFGGGGRRASAQLIFTCELPEQPASEPEEQR